MADLVLLQSSNGGDEPWSGWSRFVPRLSWRDSYLLSELPADRSTTIAKSLAQAGGDTQLVLRAHASATPLVSPARKVLLEPEAWHNQRPRGERSKEFNALGRASLQRRLDDPAALRSASAQSLLDYVSAYLDVEELRHSDALVLPYHIAGGLGSAGRDGELRLAEAGAELVRSRRLAERGDIRKPVLAGVAFPAAALRSPSAAAQLARSYSGLGVDGYWVQVANLTEANSLLDVQATCVFMHALQELSGARVFAVDVKNLVWPLMAAGLAGGCLGIGEREQWAGPTASSTKRRKIKPTVVHRTLLRNLRVSASGIATAFREYPCDCGIHDADSPPASRPAIRRHAMRVRLAMADEVEAHGRAAIERWLHTAGYAAADVGLEQPNVAAYRTALATGDDWRAAAGL